MKKLLLSAAVTCLLASAPVFAQQDMNLDVNMGGGEPPSAHLSIGQPPVVVAPQPVYVAPPPQTVIIERPDTYDEHHREHDRRYWERRREEERREHEHREHEHREHDHHDHDDHHDHHEHDDYR